MQHSIIAEGFGVRLRPVRLEDAPFIIWLRNLEHVKGKLGDLAPDVGKQEAWLRKYFERAGDYYFLVESLGGHPAGTHSVFDIQGTTGEMGRWVIRPGVQAAAASNILLFDLCFGQLGLQALLNLTVMDNLQGLSLSRKFGFKRTRIEPASRVIGGKPVDVEHSVLTAEDWTAARARLLPLAKMAEGLMADWDRSQLQSPSPAPWLANLPVAN